MKTHFLLWVLFPMTVSAQYAQPRFENDTLYTSGGYKIYKGQVLHFAAGTSDGGYFRFVKFHSNMFRNDTYTLQHGTMVVNKLRNFKGGDDANIRITGNAVFQNNSKAEVDIILNFEKAIQGTDGLAPELTVPEEFRAKRMQTALPQPAPKPVAAELKKEDGPIVAAEPKKQPVPDDLKKLLVADEIKKLFDLYKAGALTKEEYEARKKKLLEQ